MGKTASQGESRGVVNFLLADGKLDPDCRDFIMRCCAVLK